MQFSDIKAIFFDIDGTLADTTKIHIDVYNKVLQENANFNSKKVNIQKYFGPPFKSIINNMIKDKVITVKSFENLEKLWMKEYDSKLTKNLVYKDVDETLNYLSKKYLLGVISSSRESAANIILQDVKNYFITVITAGSNLPSKPDPYSLQVIAKNLNLKPENIMYVGDNTVDIIFAKNAKVKSVGKVDYLYSKKELEIYKPDLIIENISDLKRYL